MSSSGLRPDPFHLIEAEFLSPAIVELRRVRAGVVLHLRRLLQRPAVFEIRRDPGRPEAVIAELGRDGGRRAGGSLRGRSAAAGECASTRLGATSDRRKEQPLGIPGEARALDVGGKVGLKVVVTRHGVRLAAFLAQPHPLAAVLREHVFDRHAKRRADARERIDHEGDERPIAQPGMHRDIDAVDESARFHWLRHWASCRPSPHATGRAPIRPGSPVLRAVQGRIRL